MDFVLSSIALVLSIIIFLLWYKHEITLIEGLLISTCLSYYKISFLGPTINVLFLFQIFVSACLVISKKVKFSKFSSILFILTIFSFLIYYILLPFFYKYFNGLNIIDIFINQIIYVIKYLFPILVCISYIQISKYETIEVFYKSLNKVAIASAAIAIFQLLLFITITNNFVRELFGLIDGNKYQYSLFGIDLVRIQAFCYEPKGLSVILGLSFPLLIIYKRFFQALFVFIVGVLTVSQTFFIVLLAAVFLFLLYKYKNAIRFNVVMAILMFFFMFNLISSFINLFQDINHNSLIYKVVLDRALQRFDITIIDNNNNDLFGLPLQRDLELPAINFFRDHNLMILSGFGTGNYKFIPSQYFVSDWNEDMLAKGTFKGHFDMGWIFFVSEFGILFSLLLFYLITNVNSNKFNNYYFSFLLVVFFFHRIDIILFSFFSLMNKKYEIFNRNHFLQSS